LNIDNRLGLPQSRRKPLVLPPQSFQLLLFFFIRFGFAAALLWHQPCFALPSPIRQVRRVQPFTPQQFPELSRLRAPIRLAENPRFVWGRESASRRLFDDLGRILILSFRVLRHPVPPRPLQ